MGGAGRERLALADPHAFAAWLTPLYQSEWVVYAKPPFGGPAQVLKHLARSTHRVAIGNHRLLDLKDGRVSFRWKDYAHGHRERTRTLGADEFLRRFLQHVLPRGFVRIRHYGPLANRCREEKLARCRLLLPVAVLRGKAAVVPAGPAVAPCPGCGVGPLVVVQVLPRPAGDPAPAAGGNTGPARRRGGGPRLAGAARGRS
jgi:hypothetical protein